MQAGAEKVKCVVETWLATATPEMLRLYTLCAKAKGLLPVCNPEGASLTLRMVRLESDLRRELHAARSAAAQKRVADSHIAGGGQGIKTRLPPERAVCRKGIWRSGIRDEIRQNGIGEVRMVQEVEELGTQLQVHPFTDGGVLEE